MMWQVKDAHLAMKYRYHVESWTQGGAVLRAGTWASPTDT